MAKTKLDYLTSQINTAVAKVFSAFNGTTGHKHTGNTEDAPQIETLGIKDGAVTDVKIGNRVINTVSKTLTEWLQYFNDNYYTKSETRKVFNISDGSVDYDNQSIDGIYYDTSDLSDIKTFDIKTVILDRIIEGEQVYSEIICQIKYSGYQSYIRFGGRNDRTSDIGWVNSGNGFNGFWGISTTQTAPNIVEVPANSFATGTANQIAYDNDYFYVCTATNTWIRFAKTTW